jgi:hypothetical protein
MSLRNLGTLARQRRGAVGAQGAAAAAGGDSVTSLEAAVPTEVVALYTAIIAGAQSVLHDDPHATYFAFRLIIYLIALAATVYVAIRNVAKPAGGKGKAIRSPEVLTAILAFASWGLVLPGSFLYVWLGTPVLSIVVITITASASFLLAAVFAPRLRSRERGAPGTGPPLTNVPPGRTAGGQDNAGHETGGGTQTT